MGDRSDRGGKHAQESDSFPKQWPGKLPVELRSSQGRRCSSTSLVMRRSSVIDRSPLVLPKPSVKILGVVFDQQPRFKERAARAAKRGIRAVLALKRL
jgi:hypothetical protein